MSKRAWFIFGALVVGGIVLQIPDTTHLEHHPEAGGQGHDMPGMQGGGADPEPSAGEGLEGPRTVVLEVTGMT